MESQRLGYRLDASAMSGRLRKRGEVNHGMVHCGYSKRCQRDLERFYTKALKDVENNFSSLNFQIAPKEESPSFTVLKQHSAVLPLPIADIKPLPVATTARKKMKKQKSVSYTKIRHSCNETLHLSIDCNSPNDERRPSSSHRKTITTTTRRQSAEKRVKFKRSLKSESPCAEEIKVTCENNFNQVTSSSAIPQRANYLVRRNQASEETRDKQYMNELFHCKFSAGEMERDVQGFVRLNYTMVAKYLGYPNSSYKHKLLQALRWRLNLNEKLTRRTLEDFHKHDLLRVKQNHFYERTLIESLLWPPRGTANGNFLQNGMARLLNGIVSYPEGREYFEGASVAQHLMWGEGSDVFRVEPSRQFVDNSTAAMLVAVLMKLSTGMWQKKDMLSKNVLPWILGHLEDIEYSGSAMQVKYSLLLLNSLLRLPEAVDELTRRTSQVLVLLARYLKRDRGGGSEWLFTVKAILVKLFKRKEFRGAAKEMNFETLLRRLINPMDFRAKKELEFMILFLNDSGNITQLPCSASPFEVEEKIQFDPEIEEEDLTGNCPGLEGELLLEEQFARYKMVVMGEEGEGVVEKKENMEKEAKEENQNEKKEEEIQRIFEVVQEGDVVEDAGEKDVREEKVDDEEEIGLPEENVKISSEEELSSVVEDLKAKEGVGGVDELQNDVVDDDKDDNEDVVIGGFEEEQPEEEKEKESVETEIVIIPASESESPSPEVKGGFKMFPSSLSISSQSLLEDVVPIRTWTEFPVKR